MSAMPSLAKRKAIVIMAVGERHRRLLRAARGQFEKYCDKCNAELIVCTQPPDPAFRRTIITQKLLLPKLVKAFDWVAVFDLDVVISDNAPSIFAHADESKGFGAVLSPRGTQGFRNYYAKLPEVLRESSTSYFLDRGFPGHPSLVGAINGGVVLYNPAKVSDLFERWYYSAFEERPCADVFRHREIFTQDEGPMAYLTQTNGLFFALDEKFNTEIIYQLYSDLNSQVIRVIGTKYFRGLVRLHKKFYPPAFAYPSLYKDFVKTQLGLCYGLHFSAGYPLVNVV